MPGYLYAADVFITPIRRIEGKKRLHGSVGHVAKLSRIHRQALIMMSGAMRTSATDVLEAHCDVLPLPLLIDKLCHRAAVRLCTLPATHPLAKHVARAARQYVRHHHSTLHELMAAYQLDPKRIETIQAVRHHPSWKPSFAISIPQDKVAAIEEDDHWNERTTYRVYSDGSDFEGGVGAAAVLYKAGRRGFKSLRYHLGPSEEHTVYEAELVGEILGVELLRKETAVSRTSIAADNKSSLQATRLRRPAAGHYLVDELHKTIETTQRRRSRMELTLRWVPGHVEVEGNEQADKEAKKAASGNSSNQSRLPQLLKATLPASSSAIKQTFQATLKTKARERWENSPRFRKVNAIDSSLPGKKYGKQIDRLPRKHASLLLQLRTGHAPLNLHLHRIGKAESPLCPQCEESRESVNHFLFACPAYARHRDRLSYEIGRDAQSLRGMLGVEENLKHVFAYVNSTQRLKPTFGKVTLPEKVAQ